MTRSGLTAANPAPTSADRTATASPAATDQSKKDFFRRSRSVRPEILFSSKEATTQDAPSLKSIARPGRPAVSSQPSANQEIDTMRSINDMTASWLPLPYAPSATQPGPPAHLDGHNGLEIQGEGAERPKTPACQNKRRHETPQNPRIPAHKPLSLHLPHSP